MLRRAIRPKILVWFITIVIANNKRIVALPNSNCHKTGPALTKGGGAPLSGLVDGLSHESEQGTRYGFTPNSAAAPATVSGEPEPREPLGTIPGKAAKAETREPGDLPSIWSLTGRGASAAVGSLAAIPGHSGIGRRKAPRSW